jgi:integrase
LAHNQRETTHEVRLWAVRKVTPRKATTERPTTEAKPKKRPAVRYEVRWIVAKRERSKTFATKALAQSHLGNLQAAVNKGEAFDVESGLPVSLVPDTRNTTWWEWALQYVDLKWPDLAPKSRLSVAEAMTTATMALLTTKRNRPEPAELRRAMLQWAFIAPRRAAGGPPDDLARAVRWLSDNSVKLTAVENPVLARTVLDALARKLDGTRAAATTVARKRAVFFNALELAAERQLIDANPLPKVRWKLPKTAEAIDPACVINHDQARALLAAVAQVGEQSGGQDGESVDVERINGRRLPKGAPLVAFFACMYYAGTRPSEALALTRSDITLPDKPGEWGILRLRENDPEVTTAWTDNGERKARQLKHRARGEVRYTPITPHLAELLQRHLDVYGTGAGGRLFVGPRGGPMKESVYTDVWQAARRRVFGDEAETSPLARRPYDLRHSCVSTWLAGQVDSAQIAEWVGHSVAVLHRVYAHVIPGRGDVARRRIEDVLGPAGASTNHPSVTHRDDDGPGEQSDPPRADREEK